MVEGLSDAKLEILREIARAKEEILEQMQGMRKEWIFAVEPKDIQQKEQDTMPTETLLPVDNGEFYDEEDVCTPYDELSKDELVDKIIELEWEAFDQVENEGGRASCQNNWPTFQILRTSQYLTWTASM